VSEPQAERASARARAGWIARLGLLAASLALTGVLVEVVFRLAGFSALYSVYSKPSLFWQHDEQLGWSHQPGADGSYVGPRPFPIEFEAPVRINALGLRGPEIGPKAPGELRLLFLGDSVVAGFEVAYEDTFVARVGETLTHRLDRPVRTINAGVRGYGTDQSLLYYRERGRALGADVVLFVHSENDPLDNVTLHRARRPFGKPAFALEPGGGLRLVGRPVPRFDLCSAWMLAASGEPVDVATITSRGACALQTRLADRSAAFGFVAQTLSRWPGLTQALKQLTQPNEQIEERERGPGGEARRPGPAGLRQAALPFAAGGGGAPALADSYELTTELVRALARDVASDGARFRLLFTKAKDLEQVDLDRIRADGIDARLMVAHAPGLPTHWRNDGHLNEAGHRLVADILVRGLVPELRALPAE